MKKVFIYFMISLSFTHSKAQVFIPFSHWAERKNCTSGFCPILTIGSAALAGTAGMTQIVNTCVDDGSVIVNFPFDFYLNNTAYNNWYIGSNLYITAGAGSSVYSPLNASSPALPKFHFGSSDANYQKVYSKSGTNYIRVRYEGNSAYGTCSVNTIYEVTFYRTTLNYQYIQVVFGAHGNVGGPFGMANASTYYATATPIVANSSYVLYSTNGGVTWTILQGYSITGTGTTI